MVLFVQTVLFDVIKAVYNLSKSQYQQSEKLKNKILYKYKTSDR